MRFKYFIRGLGFGILFSCIILLATYQGKPAEKLSDAEIIERAKELGMVEGGNEIEKLLQDNSEKKQSNDEDKTESKDTSAAADSTESQEADKEQQTEADTSQEAVNTTEASGQEQVEITIERGSSSYPVCEKLQAAGMIDSAEEFDNYLVANGYADRIRVGTHILTKGMDYESIAKAIIDPE